MRLASFIVLFLAACGGKSFDNDAASNDVGGSSSSAGSSNAGSSNAGSSNAGNGQGGGAGNAACDGFHDDDATFVAVDIVNDSPSVIYLGRRLPGCEISPLFFVTDAAGNSLPSPSRCRVPCGSDSGGCPDICLAQDAIQLAPGARTATSWDGLYDVQTVRSAQCAGSSGSRDCQQAKRIEPGTFTFSAQAGSDIDCGQLSSTTTCSSCISDGDGNCRVPGAAIAGALFTATSTVELNGDYGVFGAGYPSDNPGSNAGARAPRRVEIVFE